jgi:hypothetical protein
MLFVHPWPNNESVYTAEPFDAHRVLPSNLGRAVLLAARFLAAPFETKKI